jgi:hypothetical protein
MKITKCNLCGAKIEYTTKKPKICKECKSNKKSAPKNKAKKPVETRWKGEVKLFDILNYLLPKCHYCINGYYSWLPSPNGAPMQLDWYSDELGLAFEYEGIQHYKYIKHFHKSKTEFKYLQECDKLKEKYCKLEGVVLVKIKYTMPLNIRNVAKAIKDTSPTLYNILLRDNMLNLTREDIDAISKM